MKILSLFIALGAFVVAHADPTTGSISVTANQANDCVTALTTIADYGHEQIVKQGSEPDKIIHVPAVFGGESGVVTWSIAHDIAALSKVKDESDKATTLIINQSKQLVADGHATYNATGISSSDAVGAAKIKDINDAMDKATKATYNVNVIFFAEVDFRTGDNPGFAAPLAVLLKNGLIPSHDGTIPVKGDTK